MESNSGVGENVGVYEMDGWAEGYFVVVGDVDNVGMDEGDIDIAVDGWLDMVGVRVKHESEIIVVSEKPNAPPPFANLLL